MATIHLLKPQDPERVPLPISGLSTSAEIILFPGVRYERWTEPETVAPAPKKKRRSRVKRDRMTIVV